MNDPHGIYWDGERYHLYFQSVPGATVWGPQCQWGHATSADLIAWREQPVALVPQSWEAGCWSGCVVSDAPELQAFYTRVRRADYERGAVALAVADGAGRLVSRADGVVVRPPDDPGVYAFRDPVVRRLDDAWQMIVGGGLADGRGCVFDYRSHDLVHWQSRGALCSGRVTAAGREVWECPQLIDVDGRDVLLVSLQVDGAPGPVVATVATGRFGGGTLVPADWQPLAYGSTAYATTAFTDREGRHCVMSWLRERPHEALHSDWAGAQSVPAVVGVTAEGSVTLRPHPGLTGSDRLEHRPLDRGPARIDVAALPEAVVLTAAPGSPGELRVGVGSGGGIGIVADPIDGTVVRAGDAPPVRLPVRAAGMGLDVVVDADLVEVFSAGSYGAWRVG